MGKLIRRHAAAVAVVCLVAAAGPVAGASAATSSGYNNWSCRPSAAHPNPVVLLHGLGATYYEDTGMFIAPYLAAEGYCVYGLTYGGTSVFGPLVGGVGDINTSAQQIGQFVDAVLSSTGAAKVDLVGHSEGAFQSLYVPKVTGDAGEIARVVALAPPTHGTTFAGLISLARNLGIQSLVEAITTGIGCDACSQFVATDGPVQTLDAGPIAQPGIAYTVITSKADELVTPTTTSFVPEPGVTNEYVQRFCPLDPVGHIGEAYDLDVAELISNALNPANARPVVCSIGLPF
jgi:triacylglycerol esterase/lipase EstA (alpha/beta hydrolase family)